MKIAHVCNYAPGFSGMYGTVKDLLLEERRRGMTAEIIDDIGGYDILEKQRDEIIPAHANFGTEADIICWHHAMFEDWFNEPHRNLVLFLHGTPEFNFFTELAAKDKDRVLSLIIGLSNLKIPKRIVSMWERHVPFWESMLQMPVDFVPAWVNLDKFLPNQHKVEKDTIKIAMVDFWRLTREPFGIIAAIDYLRKHSNKKIEVNVWGMTEIPNKTYQAVVQWLYDEDILKLKGNTPNPHEDIYCQNDLVVSMSTEETRVVRESFSSGIPVVCGRHGLHFTDYCADCINPELLAKEIDRCHEDLLKDQEKIRNSLRSYAESNFDVTKSCEGVLNIFENIMEKHGSPNNPKIIKSNGVRMVAGLDETADKIKDRLLNNEPVTYVRFGDGDLILMNGAAEEGYHKNSPELQQELIEAYSIKDEGFLVGSVAGMINEKHMRAGVFARFSYDDPLREIAEKYRPGETLENAVALLYKSVFEASWFVNFLRECIHGKKILFIGNEAVNENGLVQSVFDIDTVIGMPPKDAYYVLDDMMPQIEKEAQEHDIIICASGMATRVIAKRLWKKDIKTSFIDIGSIVDGLLGTGTRGWIRAVGDIYRETYEQEFIGGKVDIVVLSYGQEEKTIKCFESIAENTKNYRVIWVDNGSGEKSINKVIPTAKKLEECEIIKSTNNLGFSKGVNLALRKILSETGEESSSYILLLNNDVIVTPNWINRLKLAMTNSNVEVLGPLTSENNPHAVENFVNVVEDLPKLNNEDPIERSEILWKHKKWDVLEVQNMISFFCCLMTRNVVEQTGLLDENLFAYGEDNDYCIRLKACNRKIGVAIGCYVHHDHSVTSKSFGDSWIEKRKKEAATYLKSKYPKMVKNSL